MDMLAHCVPMGLPADAQRGIHRGIEPLPRSVRWVPGGREGAWSSRRLFVATLCSSRTEWDRLAAIGTRSRQMEARERSSLKLLSPGISFSHACHHLHALEDRHGDSCRVGDAVQDV